MALGVVVIVVVVEELPVAFLGELLVVDQELGAYDFAAVVVVLPMLEELVVEES